MYIIDLDYSLFITGYDRNHKERIALTDATYYYITVYMYTYNY